MSLTSTQINQIQRNIEHNNDVLSVSNDLRDLYIINENGQERFYLYWYATSSIPLVGRFFRYIMSGGDSIKVKEEFVKVIDKYYSLSQECIAEVLKEDSPLSTTNLINVSKQYSELASSSSYLSTVVRHSFKMVAWSCFPSVNYKETEQFIAQGDLKRAKIEVEKCQKILDLMERVNAIDTLYFTRKDEEAPQKVIKAFSALQNFIKDPAFENQESPLKSFEELLKQSFHLATTLEPLKISEDPTILKTLKIIERTDFSFSPELSKRTNEFKTVAELRKEIAELETEFSQPLEPNSSPKSLATLQKLTALLSNNKILSEIPEFSKFQAEQKIGNNYFNIIIKGDIPENFDAVVENLFNNNLSRLVYLLSTCYKKNPMHNFDEVVKKLWSKLAEAEQCPKWDEFLNAAKGHCEFPEFLDYMAKRQVAEDDISYQKLFVALQTSTPFPTINNFRDVFNRLCALNFTLAWNAVCQLGKDDSQKKIYTQAVDVFYKHCFKQNQLQLNLIPDSPEKDQFLLDSYRLLINKESKPYFSRQPDVIRAFARSTPVSFRNLLIEIRTQIKKNKEHINKEGIDKINELINLKITPPESMESTFEFLNRQREALIQLLQGFHSEILEELKLPCVSSIIEGNQKGATDYSNCDCEIHASLREAIVLSRYNLMMKNFDYAFEVSDSYDFEYLFKNYMDKGLEYFIYFKENETLIHNAICGFLKAYQDNRALFSDSKLKQQALPIICRGLIRALFTRDESLVEKLALLLKEFTSQIEDESLRKVILKETELNNDLKIKYEAEKIHIPCGEALEFAKQIKDPTVRDEVLLKIYKNLDKDYPSIADISAIYQHVKEKKQIHAAMMDLILYQKAGGNREFISFLGVLIEDEKIKDKIKDLLISPN